MGMKKVTFQYYIGLYTQSKIMVEHCVCKRVLPLLTLKSHLFARSSLVTTTTGYACYHNTQK